jgi:AcrR family transcriptional regulator
MDTQTNESGLRGPTDHSKRDQIVGAAGEHFSRYGYAKTTVSDLAKAIDISKAYIYKFFDSKQAIGEAICAQCLRAILSDVHERLLEARSPTDKLRRMFRRISELTAKLFFDERKLYEIAAFSYAEKWHSSAVYGEQIAALLKEIIVEGREAGEFERKTPLDETCRAILQTMQPFINPVILQHNLDLLPDGLNEVTNLVLRSLAP